MYAKVFVVSALAAAASAQLPAVARRDFIEARQTVPNLDPTCTAALTSLLPLYNLLPTPPPALLTMTDALPTDPCVTPTLTGSVGSAYTSYVSSVYVWYSSYSSDIFAALSKCPALTQYATGIPVCSTAGGAVVTTTTSTGSGSTATITSTSSRGSGSTTGSTTGGSSSVNPSSTSVTRNAAARETGFYAAGVAAAGLLAAVAAL